MAIFTSSGFFGLTSSCMPKNREPNIFRNTLSGMIAKLSCELPRNDPFFSLTPTTRKCRLPILIDLVDRIGRTEQLVCHIPSEHRDGTVRVDLGRADQPAPAPR